jgi:hypothetical protein
MEIKNAISEMLEKTNQIKSEISKIIMAMPDNPDIKRIKGNENCFIVNFSQLSKDTNLSPCYYDFKYQYRAIIKKIDTCDILTLDKTIEGFINDGYVKLYGGLNMHSQGTFEKIKLHPTVINELKKLLN